jgi:hypothetical protein
MAAFICSGKETGVISKLLHNRHTDIIENQKHSKNDLEPGKQINDILCKGEFDQLECADCLLIYS